MGRACVACPVCLRSAACCASRLLLNYLVYLLAFGLVERFELYRHVALCLLPVVPDRYKNH